VVTFPTVNQFDNIGRDIPENIWNRLTYGDFDIYSLCVASLHNKMKHIFLSVLYRKNSIVTFQTVSDDDTVIEVVFISL